MSTEIKGYAAFEPKGQFKPWSYTPRALGDDDVEVKITHCGLCGSDVHQLDSGWGPAKYPLIPGHEIVGHVVSKGSKVSKFEVGQRVGVGVQVLTCGECNECTHDLEAYCSKGTFTYNSKYPDGTSSYGGYAEGIRAHQHFVFAIPENLSSEGTAPLLCAGITTYSPLKHFGVTKGTKLGVVGIGGLGHMAIKWGHAFGAEVTAVSSSNKKEKLSKELGAHFYIDSSQKGALQEKSRYFDVILSTLSSNVDLSPYINMLKVDGRMIAVGLPEEPIALNPGPLIWGRRSLTGSLIGSPKEIEEMLKFASEHKIECNVQVFPIEKVNDAIQGFRDNKPEFRFVFKLPTEK